jgi:hypothetical protein
MRYVDDNDHSTAAHMLDGRPAFDASFCVAGRLVNRDVKSALREQAMRPHLN